MAWLEDGTSAIIIMLGLAAPGTGIDPGISGYFRHPPGSHQRSLCHQVRPYLMISVSHKVFHPQP